jgi:hypothetical protein
MTHRSRRPQAYSPSAAIAAISATTANLYAVDALPADPSTRVRDPPMRLSLVAIFQQSPKDPQEGESRYAVTLSADSLESDLRRT